MSRSRNIKPGFFRNEVLVELPFEFRLLFIGLWTVADRKGRFEDRPTKIKMEVFPGDAVDVDAGLQALHNRNFIQRYEAANGGRYCQILAWDKHQNPHHKEAESVIPEPFGIVHGGEASGSGAMHGGKASDKPEASPRLSCHPRVMEEDKTLLIPDSGFPIPDPLTSAPSRFEEFIAIYPRKQGANKAQAEWNARDLDSIADRIMADVQDRIARHRNWISGYPPAVKSYIHNSGWEEAIDEVPAKPSGAPGYDPFGGGV